MRVKNTALIISVFLLLASAAAHAQTAGVVTLRANSTSASGSLVPVLTWSTNPTASSCRASGGWSGNKTVAGNETLARISASTNYTLTCTWSTGSSTVSWVAPTQNTNGTALVDLAGFRVYYGTSSTSLTQTSVVNNVAARTTTINSLAPGTWYFKVRAFNASQTESTDSNVAAKAVAGATAAGTVGITITGTPPPPPPPPTGSNEVEPNNYTGQAQLVATSGTTVNGNMSSSSDGDYYRINLPAGKRLTAVMTPNSSSDYELYLYNSSGTAIAWSENGRGVAETVTVTNSGSSTVAYYVRVHYYGGGTGSTNGKYTIRLSW
jgi:serine protease